MSADTAGAPHQVTATPAGEASAEGLTLRGLGFGLLFAAPLWLLLALLITAVF